MQFTDFGLEKNSTLVPTNASINASEPSSLVSTPGAHSNAEEDLNILIWKLALAVALCLALFIGSLVILVTIAYSRRKAAQRSQASAVCDAYAYQNPSDVLLDENEAFQDIDANGNNNGSVVAPAMATPSVPECRTPIYLPGAHTLQPITEEVTVSRPRPSPTHKLNSAPFNIQNYQTSSSEVQPKQMFVTLEV